MFKQSRVIAREQQVGDGKMLRTTIRLLQRAHPDPKSMGFKIMKKEVVLKEELLRKRSWGPITWWASDIIPREQGLKQ